MAESKGKEPEENVESAEQSGKQESLYEQLSKPFPPDSVEWIILNARDIRDGNNFWVWAIASPYIQKESAEDRADQVFGPDYWENDFTMPDKDGRFSYWITYEWNGKVTVKKAGGSLDTDAQGNFNDADFEIALAYAEKRAWQKVGIGRYLKLVESKKVHTELDFQAGWNKYSFKSKWQKKKNGNPKYIDFYWKTPQLPNKALPPEFRDTQEPEDTGRPGRQKTKVATDDQWEVMESYLENVPDNMKEKIRSVIYNESVNNDTAEVTYERKRFSEEFADKVIDQLNDRFGPLEDLKEANKPEPEPEEEDGSVQEDESTKEKPNPEKSEQEDMFGDGKKRAQQAYGEPD